jgi:hypothetical protein
MRHQPETLASQNDVDGSSRVPTGTRFGRRAVIAWGPSLFVSPSTATGSPAVPRPVLLSDRADLGLGCWGDWRGPASTCDEARRLIICPFCVQATRNGQPTNWRPRAVLQCPPQRRGDYQIAYRQAETSQQTAISASARGQAPQADARPPSPELASLLNAGILPRRWRACR